MLERETIEGLARLGGVRQARSLAARRLRGSKLNAALSAICRTKPTVFEPTIYVPLHHSATGGGIPFSMSFAVAEASVSEQVLRSGVSTLLPSLGAIADTAWRDLMRLCGAVDGGHGGQRSAPPPHISAHVPAQFSDVCELASGRSAELAMALGMIGAWCDRSADVPVFATGILERDGSVGAVEHVEAKVIGLSEECGDMAARFIVPAGTNDLERIRDQLPPGHALVQVGSLEQAVKAAFGDAPLFVLSVPSLIGQCIRAVDHWLEADHSLQRAAELATSIDWEHLRAVSEVDWARLRVRVACAYTHLGRDVEAAELFGSVREVGRKLLDEGDFDHAETAAYLQSLVVSEIAGSDGVGPAQHAKRLEQILELGELEGINLTRDLRVRVRGALALMRARGGDYGQAVHYRRQNLDEHSAGGHRLQEHEAQTWCYLIWEAARADDFELADEAVRRARARAGSVKQWLFIHYNWLRRLELKGDYGPISDFYETATACTDNEATALRRLRDLDCPAEQPTCFARRVVGRAKGKQGAFQEGRRILHAALTSPAGTGDYVLWHQELARIELALLEANAGNMDLAETTMRASHRGLCLLHKGAAEEHRSLLESIEHWRVGESDEGIRRAMLTVYY